MLRRGPSCLGMVPLMGDLREGRGEYQNDQESSIHMGAFINSPPTLIHGHIIIGACQGPHYNMTMDNFMKMWGTINKRSHMDRVFVLHIQVRAVRCTIGLRPCHTQQC